MNIKLKTLVAAMGLGVALVGAPAIAGVTIFPNSITSFQDDDLDFVFDANNNLKTSGNLAVGDKLVSVIEVFETFDPLNGLGPNPIGPDELTGLATATITNIVDLDNNGVAELIELSANVKMYLQGPTNGTGAPNLVIVPPNCASFAACSALATDGNLYLEANSVALGWTAQNAVLDIGAVQLVGASTTVAFVNFGLDYVTAPPLPAGQSPVKQKCLVGTNLVDAHICGSGNILGGIGLTNGAVARSDFDFEIRNAAVPEPVSMALLGVGLLGLGASLRKRV